MSLGFGCPLLANVRLTKIVDSDTLEAWLIQVLHVESQYLDVCPGGLALILPKCLITTFTFVVIIFYILCDRVLPN
jgi:hypothetical protein